MTNRDNHQLRIDLLQEQVTWTTHTIAELLYSEPSEADIKATERAIQASSIRFEPLKYAIAYVFGNDTDFSACPPSMIKTQQTGRARSARNL